MARFSGRQRFDSSTLRHVSEWIEIKCECWRVGRVGRRWTRNPWHGFQAVRGSIPLPSAMYQSGLKLSVSVGGLAERQGAGFELHGTVFRPSEVRFLYPPPCSVKVGGLAEWQGAGLELHGTVFRPSEVRFLYPPPCSMKVGGLAEWQSVFLSFLRRESGLKLIGVL